MMTAMIIMMILRSFFGMIFNGTAHYSTGRREEEGRKDGLRSQVSGFRQKIKDGIHLFRFLPETGTVSRVFNLRLET